MEACYKYCWKEKLKKYNPNKNIKKIEGNLATIKQAYFKQAYFKQITPEHFTNL